MSSDRPILEARGLSRRFALRGGLPGTRRRAVQAVSDVSLRLMPGKTLGVVGESGCGKSTLARLLMGLIEPDSGEILLDGKTRARSGPGIKAFRRQVQMVFQDSSASLNPRLSIVDSVIFGQRVHGVRRAEARAKAEALLERVGLAPAQFAGRFPHELSGGQRQRVNIARALALDPRVVIFDEAVSALDKSVEAQVLNLLADLKDEFALSYVFISHDLNVVRHVSDDVVVMYLGEIIEEGAGDDLFLRAGHPYTRALLAAMPSPDPEARTPSPPITGDPPNPIDLPSGCRFHPRCSFAGPTCVTDRPWPVGTPGDHRVACHMANAASGHARAGSVVP